MNHYISTMNHWPYLQDSGTPNTQAFRTAVGFDDSVDHAATTATANRYGRWASTQTVGHR